MIRVALVDDQNLVRQGVRSLLALAEDIEEIKTICHCGRKATMVVRRSPDGRALRAGAQIQIGGNETYVSLCRRHWREEVGDLPDLSAPPAG